MADRTSASIFAMVFEFLAKTPDARSRAFARKMWAERTAFDFSDYQMGADAALVKLNLADKCRKCGAVDYEDDEIHECEERNP